MKQKINIAVFISLEFGLPKFDKANVRVRANNVSERLASKVDFQWL